MPRAEVFEALRLRFEASEFALGAEVAPERLLECLRLLRDHHGYRFYICALAVDRPEHFEVLHGLRNTDTFEEFWVKVKLSKAAAGANGEDGPNGDASSRSEPAPELDSASLVFSGADWHEREILDLFGVSFVGHPNPTRILMPDDYDGHPLRKDFAMDTPWGYRPATRGEGGEGSG